MDVIDRGITDVSRPVRARGLKPWLMAWIASRLQVAPRTGAWIETLEPSTICQRGRRRAPYGRVD